MHAAVFAKFEEENVEGDTGVLLLLTANVNSLGFSTTGLGADDTVDAKGSSSLTQCAKYADCNPRQYDLENKLESQET